MKEGLHPHQDQMLVVEGRRPALPWEKREDGREAAGRTVLPAWEAVSCLPATEHTPLPALGGRRCLPHCPDPTLPAPLPALSPYLQACPPRLPCTLFVVVVFPVSLPGHLPACLPPPPHHRKEPPQVPTPVGLEEPDLPAYHACH